MLFEDSLREVIVAIRCSPSPGQTPASRYLHANHKRLTLRRPQSGHIGRSIARFVWLLVSGGAIVYNRILVGKEEKWRLFGMVFPAFV
jgi:hypothetical protein